MKDCVIVSIDVTTPDNVTVTYPVAAGYPVPGPGIEEAPSDGITRGRRNGAWADVGTASLPAGGVEDDVLTKLSGTDGDAAFRNPFLKPIDCGTFN